MPGLHILDLQITPGQAEIIITAQVAGESACCSDCQTPSQRIHSQYLRQPQDLPIQEKSVRLYLKVRRFFCCNPNCARKTFAEQVPDFLRRYARRTNRVVERLMHLVLASGFEGGARLSRREGLTTSGDTLLRLARRLPVPERAIPRVLGIDDWALRKGVSYGTILVDLERHQPIDLLPDREAKTVAAWLKARPGIEVISRDRGTPYKDGATEGAPTALQVADRWHLLHNLRETVQEVLELHRAQLTIPVDPASAPSATSPGTPTKKKAWAYNRAERLARYEAMVELAKQGLDNRAIAQAVGGSVTTVRHYLAAGQFPEWQPSPVVSKWLTPYVAYLQQRWAEGCHNSAQLWREVCQQGYGRSRTLVYNYVARLRNGLPTAPWPVQTPLVQAVRRYSPRQAFWLLVCPPDKLDAEQTRALHLILQRCPDAEQAYQLAQTFANLVRERQPDALQPWMRMALESTLGAFHKFVGGLHRDLAAVKAALSTDFSNGQTEGQVNRLKLLKRQMYGRAKFELLRLRVLLGR